MEYISVRDAAQKWSITERRVQYFCSNDKIPGAKSIGKQWLIPSDAERPIDGRSKKARVQPEFGQYHFPIFIHSRFFVAKGELNEEDRLLFDAQIKYMSGEYPECILLCRKAIGDAFTSSVKFGAYCLIGYTSVLLGINSEYHAALEAMEAIIAKEKLHKADYLLMYNSLKLHTEFNFDIIRCTNPYELSPDAITYFQHLLILCSVTERVTVDKNTLFFYEAFVRRMHAEGIAPCLLSVHAMMSALYQRIGDEASRKKHMQIACDIAVNNGWMNLLAKFYTIDTDIINECLNFDDRYLSTLKRLQKQIIKNWAMIHITSNGISPLPEYTPGQSELLYLISCDFSHDSIALILNVSKAELDENITTISKLCGVPTEELAAFARKQFKILQPQ